MDLTRLDLSWLENAGEEYRVEQSRTALRDAFLSAAEAVGAVMALDTGSAMTAILEASRAADEAYEPGSPEAVAFALILAAVGEEAFGETS